MYLFIYLLNSYDECIFVSGECIDNECTTQTYGSCTHPCIGDEEEESCVYDECAKYTEETCLTQTENACDLTTDTTTNNNNNNKICKTHVTSDECEEYLYDIYIIFYFILFHFMYIIYIYIHIYIYIYIYSY
jgi:hypothetical protein